MHPIDSFTVRWLPWMIDASWQLALLVVIVAAVCALAKSASPRLRHALWLLVLLKLLLPPSLESPLSVGRLGLAPLLEAGGVMPTYSVTEFRLLVDVDLDPDHIPEILAAHERKLPSTPKLMFKLPLALLIVWLVGCVLFWVIVASRYLAVRRLIGAARPLAEGPVRVALERLALKLKLRHVPEILATREIASPFLFGTLAPRIVLPEALLSVGDPTTLEAVLMHELAHFKRRDTWIGWLQVVAQSLFWFHPFLWWANRRLRDERECACDELVLRQSRISPHSYGEAILKVVIEMRARSLVAGSLVGVFEPGGKLENRLEEIMRFEPSKREFTWWSRLALVAFAVLVLPMTPGAHVIHVDADAADVEKLVPKGPQIVKTVPERGAINVGPDLPGAQVIYLSEEKTGAVSKVYIAEISVTFDRDMKQGMSWTGGKPFFPTTEPKTRPARWIDARTCVLPVSLAEGAYYRVGINSDSFHNFQDTSGVPAAPSVIGFVTAGATDEVKARVRAPKVVKLSPTNGADDVDPSTELLKVTFDVPMADGMSWTGSGSKFPGDGENGLRRAWSNDGRQCTLPVSLESGHEYELGLNSAHWNNFQSKWGIPLEPVVYKFHTRGVAKPAAAKPAPKPPAAPKPASE